MVDRAHCNSVRYDWFATLGVLSDVRRVEEFCMAEATDGALLIVGQQHTAAELRLVEAAANDAECIFAPAGFVGTGQ
jgi:hypothetical protein